MMKTNWSKTIKNPNIKSSFFPPSALFTMINLFWAYDDILMSSEFTGLNTFRLIYFTFCVGSRADLQLQKYFCSNPIFGLRNCQNLLAEFMGCHKHEKKLKNFPSYWSSLHSIHLFSLGPFLYPKHCAIFFSDEPKVYHIIHIFLLFYPVFYDIYWNWKEKEVSLLRNFMFERKLQRNWLGNFRAKTISQKVW